MDWSGPLFGNGVRIDVSFARSIGENTYVADRNSDRWHFGSGVQAFFGVYSESLVV